MFRKILQPAIPNMTQAQEHGERNQKEKYASFKSAILLFPKVFWTRREWDYNENKKILKAIVLMVIQVTTSFSVRGIID